MPPLLQPVAHALIQAQEEVGRIVDDFPPEQLWSRPAGVASVGFHLQHLSGILDRLFTYARGEQLDPRQRDALAAEGRPEGPNSTLENLLRRYDSQIQRALEQLRAIDPATLTERREVGRGRLPSTVIGLLFHAAEHSQRHVGQLLVTARILNGSSGHA